MKFWRLEIKYSKIPLPDIILFSDKASAEWYKEDKLKHNPLVRWVTISDKPEEITLWG